MIVFESVKEIKDEFSYYCEKKLLINLDSVNMLMIFIKRISANFDQRIEISFERME